MPSWRRPIEAGLLYLSMAVCGVWVVFPCRTYNSAKSIDGPEHSVAQPHAADIRPHIVMGWSASDPDDDPSFLYHYECSDELYFTNQL